VRPTGGIDDADQRHRAHQHEQRAAEDPAPDPAAIGREEAVLQEVETERQEQRRPGEEHEPHPGSTER
jgi:hypothetical protein